MVNGERKSDGMDFISIILASNILHKIFFLINSGKLLIISMNFVYRKWKNAGEI